MFRTCCLSSVLIKRMFFFSPFFFLKPVFSSGWLKEGSGRSVGVETPSTGTISVTIQRGLAWPRDREASQATLAVKLAQPPPRFSSRRLHPNRMRKSEKCLLGQPVKRKLTDSPVQSRDAGCGFLCGLPLLAIPGAGATLDRRHRDTPAAAGRVPACGEATGRSGQGKDFPYTIINHLYLPHRAVIISRRLCESSLLFPSIQTPEIPLLHPMSHSVLA